MITAPAETYAKDVHANNRLSLQRDIILLWYHSRSSNSYSKPLFC